MKKIFFIILVLVSRAFAGSATVSWDANTESDLSGYNIYYGTNSGSYDDVVNVGNNISWFVNNLTVNVIYYFVVTAYDFSGNESEFSDEVSTTISPDNRQPSPWQISLWNNVVPSEEITLEVVAQEDETLDDSGWTVWGHANREIKEAGIFILNPDNLLVMVSFDAKIIGEGSCLASPRSIRIEPQGLVWRIRTTWEEVKFTSAASRIFINYFDDCWIPNESDANLRIENIQIF